MKVSKWVAPQILLNLSGVQLLPKDIKIENKFFRRVKAGLIDVPEVWKIYYKPLKLQLGGDLGNFDY
jgi:hypothetical protein